MAPRIVWLWFVSLSLCRQELKVERIKPVPLRNNRVSLYYYYYYHWYHEGDTTILYWTPPSSLFEAKVPELSFAHKRVYEIYSALIFYLHFRRRYFSRLIYSWKVYFSRKFSRTDFNFSLFYETQAKLISLGITLQTWHFNYGKTFLSNKNIFKNGTNKKKREHFHV